MQFNLNAERVVVIGNGNVAMDVTRILMAPVDELATTDMADHALDALRTSQVKQVVMLGRRGPVQAAFTTPELKEFGELAMVDVILDPEDFMLDDASQTQLANEKVAARNYDVMQEYLARPLKGMQRSIHMQFLWSPVEILGTGGQVTGVVVERNRLVPDGNGGVKAEGTGERRTIACGIVMRSVGYRSVPIAGVPFDDRRGLIPNQAGRITERPDGELWPRSYVVGWAKRGPSGIIGTNKPDSVATVQSMKADWEGMSDRGALSLPDVHPLLQTRCNAVVEYTGWQAIDAYEVAQGAAQQRPRVKVTSVADMLEIAQTK